MSAVPDSNKTKQKKDICNRMFYLAGVAVVVIECVFLYANRIVHNYKKKKEKNEKCRQMLTFWKLQIGRILFDDFHGRVRHFCVFTA